MLNLQDLRAVAAPNLTGAPVSCLHMRIGHLILPPESKGDIVTHTFLS